MWQKLKQWANRLKSDLKALTLATTDPRAPLEAKLMAAFTIAYALSPIDLIPDFIPVLGLLDDLLLLAIGIWVTIKLLPPGLIEEYRQRIAESGTHHLPAKKNKRMAFIIVLVWVLVLWWGGLWAWRWYQNRS